VQVYSSIPAEFGEPNTLICLVQAFHPPEITIELLKDGAVLPNANQTDLSFDKTWHFHLSKFADITPSKEESYACQVTHIGKRTVHAWGESESADILFLLSQQTRQLHFVSELRRVVHQWLMASDRTVVLVFKMSLENKEWVHLLYNYLIYLFIKLLSCFCFSQNPTCRRQASVIRVSPSSTDFIFKNI
jgi:hypothetical protein